jgi:hypothetical protein
MALPVQKEFVKAETALGGTETALGGAETALGGAETAS